MGSGGQKALLYLTGEKERRNRKSNKIEVLFIVFCVVSVFSLDFPSQQFLFLFFYKLFVGVAKLAWRAQYICRVVYDMYNIYIMTYIIYILLPSIDFLETKIISRK